TDGLGLLQGQIGKGKGCEQASRAGNQQRLEVQRGGQGNADGRTDGGQDEKGAAAADQQANADADRGQRRDLGEEVDEDAAAAGAQRAQDGNDAGTLGDIGLHAGPDADAADQQRAEADNDEKAHEEVVVAHHLAQAIARGAHGPAAVGKGGFEGDLAGLAILAIEQDLVALPGGKAGQRGGAVADHGKAIGGDQGGEAEAEAAHRAIGQLGEGAAGFEFGAAQGELVADGKAKLVEQDRIEQGAVDVAAGCEEIDDGRAGRQLRAQHLAQQRIAGTHRGEVDEGFGGLGFGAQIGIDYGNDGAEAGHGGQFLWGGDAIGAGQLNIAAHQFGGAGVDGAGNAGADRVDPGYERGADGEVHDQQQEAAQVAALV